MPRRGDGIYQRGKSWYLDCRINGQRHVERIGKGITRTVAQDLARVKRGAILKGEAGIGRKRKDLPLEQAADLFLEWVRANRRATTFRSYGKVLGPVRRFFAGKRLGQITAFDLERYKRHRIEGQAPVSANRELAALKALINRCQDWGRFEGDNPVRKVKYLKESPGRIRYLELEEEARLLAECSEPQRTVCLTGIYAGLRVASEALTLRWPNVDLRRGLLTVEAAFAKSGVTRTVPIHPILRAALERLRPAARGEVVFTKPDGAPLRSLGHGFAGACARAGLTGVTPHTLRHTFASRLVAAGVDLRSVQEAGGWSSLAMVQRYAHVAPGRLAAAVACIPTPRDSHQDSQQAGKVVALSAGSR